MAAAKSAAARGAPWAIATRRASTPAFHYPLGRDAVDSVTVTRGDLDRLKPDEFLNDNLIDFALKLFLKDAAQSPLRDSACFGDLDRDVYAFSSQFYTKMQEQRLTRVDPRRCFGSIRPRATSRRSRATDQLWFRVLRVDAAAGHRGDAAGTIWIIAGAGCDGAAVRRSPADSPQVPSDRSGRRVADARARFALDARR